MLFGNSCIAKGSANKRRDLDPTFNEVNHPYRTCGTSLNPYNFNQLRRSQSFIYSVPKLRLKFTHTKLQCIAVIRVELKAHKTLIQLSDYTRDANDPLFRQWQP